MVSMQRAGCSCPWSLQAIESFTASVTGTLFQLTDLFFSYAGQRAQ